MSRFHPPTPPSYTITQDASGACTIHLIPQVQILLEDEVAPEIYLIPTKSRTAVALALFKHIGAKFTLIYSHGNATDLGLMIPILAQMSKMLKINVIGYDYSGYGASTGSPTEQQAYNDIDAVFVWVGSALGVADNTIILYGQSLGSGPSTYIASRKSVAGLVLHSAIMSGLRVLTEKRGIFACCDIFPNIDRIRRVRCLVLIIHGEVWCLFFQ